MNHHKMGVEEVREQQAGKGQEQSGFLCRVEANKVGSHIKKAE